MACPSKSTRGLAGGAYDHNITTYGSSETKVSGGLWVGTGEGSHQGPGIIKDIDVPCTSKSTCSLARGAYTQSITPYRNGRAKYPTGCGVGTVKSVNRYADISNI